MEEFYDLVRRVPDEQVLGFFPCKKAAASPTPGRLFVSSRRFYFHPDIKESNQAMELPFVDVVDVRRQTFVFSSNTITLVTSRVEYVFFNFNSFDQAYRVISEAKRAYTEDARSRKASSAMISQSPHGLGPGRTSRSSSTTNRGLNSTTTVQSISSIAPSRSFSLRSSRLSSTAGGSLSPRSGLNQMRSFILSNSGGQSSTQGINIPGDVLLSLDLEVDEAIQMCSPCSLLQGQITVTTDSLIFKSAYLGATMQEEIKINQILGIDIEQTKICNHPVEVIRTRKKKHIYSFSKDPNRFHELICSVCIELKSDVRNYDRPFLESPLRKVLKGDEEHVDTIACGQYPEVLLGGHLFVTNKKLIFHSQISTFKKKIVISFHDIWSIGSENTFVRIRTKMDEYVFGSMSDTDFFATAIHHSWREAYTQPWIRVEKLDVYTAQAYKEVNSSDLDHAEMLHRLWRAIVRDAAPVTRKMASSALNRLDFRRVGFLNSNPVSELRNCGVYGLGMITYFAEKYPDEYMAMLRYQIDPDVMLRTKKDPFSQNAKHEDSPEVGRIMPKIRESE
eukprot:TRINITY_DN534_c2_g1_i2.p1 TRINITY_DN534_c2_g1~~TRINITY_DN534_c2_g1_i2.p1  ORF type:complete len:562 (-),score=111.69 TRINITY_DN534_c2_g1_i2:102-1787(-)